MTYIQVNVTFSILKSIIGVPSHAKGAEWLKCPDIVTLVPNGEEFPHRCMQKNQTIKDA
jgi:hypothetical protein